ncbi:MAG: hypothetical protein K2X32_07570 [Phycisphaerales bacterium]|nr:hypothetical protein [Phycisphaerales bacterium]
MSQFPAKIVSQRLGELSLVESRLYWSVSRTYEPVDPVNLRRGDLLVRESGLKVTIWPPSAGIADDAAFGGLVDALYDRCIGDLPSILTGATECVQEAIGEFWQIDDEPAPAAGELIRLSELTQIDLRVGGDDHHIVSLYDIAELIGGHDLMIYLDHDFQPVMAHFDG